MSLFPLRASGGRLLPLPQVGRQPDGHVLLEDETQVDLTAGGSTHDPECFVEGSFRKSFYDTFWKQLATGTGLGLRYDLDFFVLRLDLGVALHVPYDTSKSGYYNIPKFSDGLGLHFAIGYPF